MSLFSSKIDPYSSFTIDLGPLYVERVFDSLLTRQGVKDVARIGPAERFEHYLTILRTNSGMHSRRHYAVTQFYKGHFYHQLANHSKSLEFVQHYREKALCFYQTYLELRPHHDESWYYALWQIGVLQEVLNYPWPETEVALVRASAVDPYRGEANKKIVEHYTRYRNWKTAYRYSSIAMNKYLDKNPIAKRRWFVDFHAYDWNVFRTHRIICYKLGHQKVKNAVNGTASAQTSPKQGHL